MTLSHPWLRTLAVCFMVAFGVGCGGGANPMQPSLTSPSDVAASSEHNTATSCAGNVCFSYLDDAD